jgi:protein-L-isoaspartate(D-aspartate) O-methyltransferase
MSTVDPAVLRETLVGQVRENAGTISTAVSDALRAVPRHLFLPEVPTEAAYRDDAIVTKRDPDGLPISSSSQPTIMAIMLDQLGVAPGQRVLEIGAGTGYNAALISHLVAPGGEVVSVDIDLDLVQRARASLAQAGYPQVTVVCADGSDGFAAGAPYDRIIATVGVPDLAPAWLDQLASDGRMVMPLDLGGVQRSVAFERADGHWVSRSAVACGFMRLRGGSAGPERTHVLDRDADLSILVPNGGDLDRGAVLTALAQPPTRRATQVTTGSAQVMRDLGLWLAISEPRWCALSESNSAENPRLSGAPQRVQHLRITVGMRGSDGIAVLTVEPGGALDKEMVAVGYGAGGERLATELAAHVRAWDSAGRPGDERLRIDAYPKSTLDHELPDRIVMEKKHSLLALSWPADTVRD